MEQSQEAESAEVYDTWPTLQEVPANAPIAWLKAGWQDLQQGGKASLFYGGCFAAAGWLLYFVFQQAYALMAGLTSGFLLLGPFLAMGLYDLSRQMEKGGSPDLRASLSAWRGNLSNVGLFAAVMAVVMLLWARASMVIFALFFDAGELPTFAMIVRAIVAFEQPSFALTYFAVGGFFALFVFFFSVVAVPLMLDRNTSAITSALASLVACARNPAPMLIWAACIVALVAIGFATLFLGLIVVMPLVGHATWHCYRDLVASGKT